MFFGSLFHDRDVFRIERALAGVVQNIPIVFNAGMLRAVLKLWLLSISGERQVPELNTVIGLITYRKTFIFQELRIGKERLFLLRHTECKVLFSLSVYCPQYRR